MSLQLDVTFSDPETQVFLFIDSAYCDHKAYVICSIHSYQRISQCYTMNLNCWAKNRTFVILNFVIIKKVI
jgi:hypothetical protein